MGFFKWLWGNVKRIFISFIKKAVSELTQKLVVELKEYAVSVVTELSTTDLTNEQKRKEAFKKIKEEAAARGLEYRDSSINFLIELAVQYLKGENII